MAPTCRQCDGADQPYTLHSNSTTPNAMATDIIWMFEEMPSVVALDASGPEWKEFAEPHISTVRFNHGPHHPTDSLQYYKLSAPEMRKEAWRAFQQQKQRYTKYNPPWTCKSDDHSACKLLRFLGLLTDTAPKGGLERRCVPACGVNPPDLSSTSLCLVSCSDPKVLESTPVHIDACDARNGCLAHGDGGALEAAGGAAAGTGPVLAV